MIKLDKDTKILIVGLGVMGGSYAKALSKKGYKISCITLEQKDIDYALEHKMIEKGVTYPSPEFIGEADVVVMALYPHTFIEWIKENQKYMKSGAILTDVTGVKGCVVYEVQSLLRPDVEYIPAHPMAGRERSGVEFSDDAVFRGANFIVTPTEKNTPEAIKFCKEFGKELGFNKISELTPEEHDKMIAFLSQLTHCIAVTLMTCNTMPHLEKYTGDSFRDLTRIAKINDRMWSELFVSNKPALLEEIDAFEAELLKLRKYIEDGNIDDMRAMMRYSTERRSLFDKPAE